MARVTRMLLAAAAAVAAAVLANAILSAVASQAASEGIAAPPTPVPVSRRASTAALFRSLRDRVFGGRESGPGPRR